MFCPYCGKELPEDALFCAACADSLGVGVAVAERPDISDIPGIDHDPVPAPVPPPRREKSKKRLGFLLTALCVLSLSALALLAGAYFDTVDPFGLRELLWPDQSAAPVPPGPGAPFEPNAFPIDLTPDVLPVSRGAPVGDSKENAAALLQAAAALESGLAAEAAPDPETLNAFLWSALCYAGPHGRFDETPDGYHIDPDDLNDFCRETLGTVPAGLPPGYEWRDGYVPDFRVEFIDWQLQTDGSVHARFNILYRGLLHDALIRQGRARLVPNGDPVYYRYHLAELGWEDDVPFRPSRIAAGSVLPEQAGASHGPEHLADGDPATAWIADAGGAGEWLELVWDRPREITGLTVVNGVHGDAKSMRQFNRIKGLRVDCDGFSMEFELEDVLDYYTGGEAQSVTFGRRVDTDRLTVTILSVYTGTPGSYVGVSEIELF